MSAVADSRMVVDTPFVRAHKLMRRYERVSAALGSLRTELRYLEAERAGDEGAAAELAIMENVCGHLNTRAQKLYGEWRLSMGARNCS